MLEKERGSENTDFTSSKVKEAKNEAKKLITESKPPTDLIGPQSHANNSGVRTFPYFPLVIVLIVHIVLTVHSWQVA